MARCAVGIAKAVLILDALAAAVFIVAFTVGGDEAVSDNWVGMFVAIAMLGGFIVALVAFVLAITVKIKGGEWVRLRLPLFLFPVLFTFLLLGEFFWWE
jgi:hypothetical protein